MPTTRSPQSRDDHIRARRAGGDTYEMVANDFGLSRSRVHQICTPTPQGADDLVEPYAQTQLPDAEDY